MRRRLHKNRANHEKRAGEAYVELEGLLAHEAEEVYETYVQKLRLLAQREGDQQPKGGE